MKAILYVVAILAAGGAAYFSLEHSKKFEALQQSRLDTIAENKKVSANADVKESDLKKERTTLAAAESKREELTQSITTLKSTGATLERDISELNNNIKAQDDEFSDLNKTIETIKTDLQNIIAGENITLENLPEKLQQIEEDKKAKQAKQEELTTLVAAAEKQLEQNRAEVDRLVKRKVERNAHIGRNSMESVVTAVNQEWGFLVIGAGSNSGFNPQSSLIVQRDGHLIGRVHPSAIEPTQTIAEIDFDSLATGVRLQPGDRVMLSKPTSN